MPDVENSPPQDHANVLVMPPLLYFGALVFGIAAQWIAPLRLPGPAELRWGVGAALLAGGIAVALGFARAFERSGQDKNPNTPSPSVISDGLYRYSRNPAYVSLTAILLGLGLLLNNAWLLLVAIPVVAIMNYGVIHREEAYLERTFGDEYLRYKASVRRWI
jgi:protein-S-isoprenylcysteine O-methyltransferase Ste14